MNSLKFRALKVIFTWLANLNPAARLRIGALLSWLAYKLIKPRVHIVRRNLEFCFPELSATTRERWVREHFRALSQSVVDRGALWYGSAQEIRDMIDVTGLEHIKNLIAQSKSIILLTPHFLGMDAAGTRLSMELDSAAYVYKAPNDPAVDVIMSAGRMRFNEIFLIHSKNGIRSMIKHLNAHRPVVYLPDMDFGRKGSVFIPFFGVPAATLLTTAQLAKKLDAVIIPVLSSIDLETGHYQVEVLAALENFPGDDSIEEATARLNRELETWVRRCPTQYYWVHRRFKTRPEGEAAIY
jgi:Kdo2-lipid IVA lauroyltransferase/acyltransferase